MNEGGVGKYYEKRSLKGLGVVFKKEEYPQMEKLVCRHPVPQLCAKKSRNIRRKRRRKWRRKEEIEEEGGGKLCCLQPVPQLCARRSLSGRRAEVPSVNNPTL